MHSLILVTPTVPWSPMKDFDVIIVGGGIHGAGVLQAVAAAGHSALLIEKQALASGTSSRSSKLIHGGLRYLESGQFALVRESLRERAVHLRIAPDLVELKPFFIPVYADTRRRPWQLKLGLWLYALLGGFDSSTRFGTRPEERVAAARRSRHPQSRCGDSLSRCANGRCAADPRGGRFRTHARRRAGHAGHLRWRRLSPRTASS